LEIVTEVHVVLDRTRTDRPGQHAIGISKEAAAHGSRGGGGQRGHGEAPDLTFPRAVGVQVIDLVNPPVVRLVREQACGIRTVGRPDPEGGLDRVAAEDVRILRRGIGYLFEALAEEDRIARVRRRGA